jgi:hypothetical protein
MPAGTAERLSRRDRLTAQRAPPQRGAAVLAEPVAIPPGRPTPWTRHHDAFIPLGPAAGTWPITCGTPDAPDWGIWRRTPIGRPLGHPPEISVRRAAAPPPGTLQRGKRSGHRTRDHGWGLSRLEGGPGLGDEATPVARPGGRLRPPLGGPARPPRLAAMDVGALSTTPAGQAALTAKSKREALGIVRVAHVMPA